MSSVRALMARAVALLSPARTMPAAAPAPLAAPKPDRKARAKPAPAAPDLDWMRRNAFPHPVPGCAWSDADLARTFRANVSMRTGQIILTDRRKPWQKELKNFSFDRTGTIASPRR